MRISNQTVRSKPPWRVLFFGTDEFSCKTLQALNENRMLSQVGGKSIIDTLDITHPRLKKLSPVNKYAYHCGLTQYEWPLQTGHKAPYDVGVVASFGHLIPKKIIKMFPYGILNVHPSLLPRWRGAAPLHHTILNGDTVTGISIMSIQPNHFDIGPVVAQKEIVIPPKTTFTSLRDFLSPQGGELIVNILSELPDILSSAKPQKTEGVTFAHKVIKQKSYIDWENQTVDQLDRQYRALFETLELRSEWQDVTVRLLDMIEPGHKPSLPLDPASPPGLPVFDKQQNILWIKCKDDWAGFASILIKKKMSAKSFYNGFLTKKHLKGVCFKSIRNDLFNESYTSWISSHKTSS